MGREASGRQRVGAAVPGTHTSPHTWQRDPERAVTSRGNRMSPCSNATRLHHQHVCFRTLESDFGCQGMKLSVWGIEDAGCMAV